MLCEQELTAVLGCAVLTTVGLLVAFTTVGASVGAAVGG
jgi:hypothetical protein